LVTKKNPPNTSYGTGDAITMLLFYLTAFLGLAALVAALAFLLSALAFFLADLAIILDVTNAA
jgi:hypothetical protein